jgi:hypothetical protein
LEIVNGELVDITDEVEKFQNPTAAATSAAADTSTQDDALRRTIPRRSKRSTSGLGLRSSGPFL